MGNKTRWPWRGNFFVADPEEAVFARLFRRLLFWYVSLLAVLVILLGLGIGTTVPWIETTTIEHDLSEKIPQLARTWQTAPAGKNCPLTLPGHGYMLACYDSRGRLLKSFGVQGAVEEHFLDNALVLAALKQGETAHDALDETGTEQVRFDFVFLSTSRPGMVRQASIVRATGSERILGVVQLGLTPGETLARRQIIVNIFFLCMALGVGLGAPAGGWYLARKALLPARLAFQRQRDFIANVSHELGTPLALLRANADVLLRGRARMAKEDVELLEDIVTETIYMDKMTSNMLLLARMDAGQLHLERETFDLARLAEDVALRVQTLADRSSIKLVLQQEEPAYASGDRVLLEQAVLILLDNALKYTPSGGQVSVSTFTKNGRACLRVSDTGIGIAPADLQRLGERFYRVDKARSRAVGGNGLGISIARGILAAHQGELTLTSEPGKGTSAALVLPGVRQK